MFIVNQQFVSYLSSVSRERRVPLARDSKSYYELDTLPANSEHTLLQYLRRNVGREF